VFADGRQLAGAALAPAAVATDQLADGAVDESKLSAGVRGKLVTHGDAHDHSGGDGAQIRHSFAESRWWQQSARDDGGGCGCTAEHGWNDSRQLAAACWQCRSDFQGSFGIGPGCIVGTPNDPSLTAVPPVREREWAEAFEIDGRNLYSICDGDYASALADIGQAIRAQIRPLCFPQCAADVDPVTVPVDANCQVYEENLVQQTKVPLAKCEPVGDEWIVPAGEAACFAVRIDNGGQTPGPIDDMSQVCVDEGFNVEFVVVRAAPKPAGTTLSATCELSPDKATDCPNL
jgi:hypothetical protein